MVFLRCVSGRFLNVLVVFGNSCIFRSMGIVDVFLLRLRVSIVSGVSGPWLGIWL